MYEAYYGFREKPFSLLPDPAFLYLSEKHRLALTMLQYGILNQAGFTVITGEIGSGKTTLIRQVLNEFADEVTIGLVTNTHRNFGELMQWVLLAFGLEYRDKKKVELYQTLADFIVKEYGRDRRTVLIIDEAQNLSVDALEELRMLSNINSDKNQVLQLILVGQPGLRETLRRPALGQFAQRVAVDFTLRPLNLEETWNYIRHRLRCVEGDPGLFDTRACAAVYYYSAGIPRLINVLCDTALVYGFAEQKQRIDAEVVLDVVREKARGGIFPIREERAGADGGGLVLEMSGVKKESKDG